MDQLSRKVAARWGWAVAMVEPNPIIPAWVSVWADYVQSEILKTAYADNGYLHQLQFEKTVPSLPVVKTDQQLFEEARQSVAILLPNFIKLLDTKFKEHFGMNASASGTRIFYFFASKHPLENIAVNLWVHNYRIFLSVLYAPVNLHGAMDHTRLVEMKEAIEDADLAGLALMRLGRKVLGRV